MLSFTGGLRVFLAVESCDMRNGFEPKNVTERVCRFVQEAAVVRDAAAARPSLCSPCG